MINHHTQDEFEDSNETLRHYSKAVGGKLESCINSTKTESTETIFPKIEGNIKNLFKLSP